MVTKAAPQIDARVVDQALVASFMNAEPPKVWRADMKKLTTATLELRNDNGKYRLVMIAQSGEEEVASFTDRDSGTAALQAVMNAMLAPSSTSAAIPVQQVEKKGGFFRTLAKIILVLIAIFVALVVVGGFLVNQKGVQMLDSMNLDRAGVAREGAPTTADDYFGK